MDDGYLIQVPRRLHQGRGRYWRPERSGYTNSVVLAGVYSLAEAEHIVANSEDIHDTDGYMMLFVPDPLGRMPGDVIDVGPSWNADPMLAAYLAGRRDAAKP